MGKKNGKRVIPYHEFAASGQNYKLGNGSTISLSNGRLVEVYQVEGKKDVFIRICKAVSDDSESELKFALTTEAANALAHLLFTQIDSMKELEIDVDPECC